MPLNVSTPHGEAGASAVSVPRTARETWRPAGLALADQAVVFLTTVLIARWTSPGCPGSYSIGTSVLVSSLAIQDSLITPHIRPAAPTDGNTG